MPETDRIDVCMISHRFYPLVAGGAERFRRYAPGLRERGIDLRVITRQLQGLPPEEVIDGLEIKRIPLDHFSGRKTEKLTQLAMESFSTTRCSPDVLQLFRSFPKLIPGLFSQRSRGVSLLLVGTLVWKKNTKPILQRIKDYTYTKLAFWPIQSIIASTTVMAHGMVSYGLPIDRIQVIPNGVDTHRFRPVENSKEQIKIRQSLGFTPEDQIILFIGRVSYRKGVDLLIEAWPEVVQNQPNVKLVLIGPFHDRRILPEKNDDHVEGFLNQLKKKVATSPATHQIIFTGEILNVEDYLRAADIFILPSRQEGMGNSVLEAMSTELPCVLTPYVGLPTQEFGKPGNEFLLTTFDPHEIAGVLIHLLQDKFIRTKLGTAGRKLIENTLSLEKTLDRYAEVYRKLAKRKQR